MKRPFTRVFKKPELLEQMLALRQQGWGLMQLAKHYEVDHSSIRHWCAKFNMVGPEFNKRVVRTARVVIIQGVLIAPPIPKPLPDQWYTNEYGERVFKGRSYKEIHKEAEEKRKQHPVSKVEPAYRATFKGTGKWVF